MRAAIYNQFLTTMGGGERLMGTVADVLAKAGMDVEFVTHVPVSIEKLASRFELDLPGVRIRTTPLMPFDQLSGLSAEYDLWINGSFMSVIPSDAPRSMLIVMFPFPLDKSPIGRLKQWVGRHIHRQLLVPRYVEGFFGPQELAGSRYRWTAGRGQALIETPWPGRPLSLRLVLGSFRPAEWGPVPARLSVDGRVLAERQIETTPGNYVTWDVTVPGDLTRDGVVRLTLESPVYRPYEVGGTSGEPDDYREVGLAVARVMTRHPRHYLYEALFERAVPELSRRLHGLPDERAMGYLDTYDVICPISEFSAQWLERYWEKSGTVLYPPVDVHVFTPRTERKRIILGVGRFFKGGGHEKKQHLMIRVFRDLIRDGLDGWELHLVGGSMSEAQHQRYLADCRRLAEGLPVHFHVDAPAAELKELYETASVYWHATGYGEREPIRFEHFGISVVEAMAAGCVPVVIGKGGTGELVTHGESGYVWRTLDEWRRQTLDVARDDALRARLAARAIVESKRFGRDVFQERLLSLVDGLGAPVPC